MRPLRRPATTALTAPAAGETSAAVAAGDLPAVPAQQEQAQTGDAPVPNSETSSATGEKIKVETPLVSVEISTAGGTISSVTLGEYPVSIKDTGTPFTLMSDDPTKFLIAQSGLQGADGVEAPTHKSVYTAQQFEYTLAADSTDGGTLSIPLVWESNGIKVTKTFHFLP